MYLSVGSIILTLRKSVMSAKKQKSRKVHSAAVRSPLLRPSIRPPLPTSHPASSPNRWSAFVNHSLDSHWCDATLRVAIEAECFEPLIGHSWKTMQHCREAERKRDFNYFRHVELATNTKKIKSNFTHNFLSSSDFFLSKLVSDSSLQ